MTLSLKRDIEIDKFSYFGDNFLFQILCLRGDNCCKTLISANKKEIMAPISNPFLHWTVQSFQS